MYENISPESLKSEMVSELGSDVNGAEGSYTNNLLSPVAYQLWMGYQQFQKIIDIMFMDTSDGEYVVRRCSEEGIYRREGTKSTGILSFAGSDDTTINAGTIVQTDDGLQFKTLSQGVISSGTAEIPAESIEIGLKYNVPAESIQSMVINIPGISSVSNSSAFENGSDDESIDELKQRYFLKKQMSPSSGNKTDYIKWAMEVPGVSNAKVYPLWDGAGTVKVVLIGQGNTAVGSEIVQNAQEHINESKPIGAAVTVQSASQKSINVSANVVTASDINEIKAKFQSKLAEYFAGFSDESVKINRIGAMLLETDGVDDYYNMTINDVTQNIDVSDSEVPTVGAIILTKEAD